MEADKDKDIVIESESETESDHVNGIDEITEDSDEANIDDDYFNHYVDNDVIEYIDEDSGHCANEAHNQLTSSTAPESVSTLAIYDEGNLMMQSDDENEELHSIHGSDEDEDTNIKYCQYNPTKMGKDFQFQLGMEFTSISQFKDAVREYALIHGYDVRFVKNDKVRCRVVCKSGCPWLMFVSKVRESLTYRLKTFKSEHCCGITFNGKMATSKWIAGKVVAPMRSHKNMKLGDIISFVQENYMANVSVNKALWARRKANAILNGDYAAEYHKLPDYCNEVRTRNPDTSFQLVTDRVQIEQPPIFKRIYECLEPIKRGFLAACRPIIGLDGCFLKGPFGGILLTAVARDPNDQYFPLAWAVVESENRDSWTWFLKNLFDDIGHMYEHRWVFISDQQKGLQQAFGELLGGYEHRYCVRHLYANIKSRYGGGTVIRDLVVRAAKATYVRDWEEKMNELKAVSKEAYDHLMTFPPSCWTKSHFGEYEKCDMIMNNITESFNGRLLEAREFPIIRLLEWIRTYLMTRFAENRIRVANYMGKVCPRPRRRLDKEVVESRNWVARWAGGNRFQVSYVGQLMEKFVVDLDQKTCSCRLWQVSGIPCRHTVSAIRNKREDPQDYVHFYFTKVAYVGCYAPIIEPINGEKMWIQTRLDPVEPPKYHKRPGRPKKLRRREADEPPRPHQLRRSIGRVRCAACGNYGHNKRTCKKHKATPGSFSGTQESVNVTPPPPSHP